jgi:hypothetical protein
VLSFTQFLLEELSRAQKLIVKGWTNEIQGESPANKISSDLKFNKDGRLFIPLEKTESSESDLHPDVLKHIKDKGYNPISKTHAEKEEEVTIPTGPRKGEVVKRKRQVSIGSLLSDNPTLQVKNALQGAKEGKRGGNLKVVISRNPIDVAGQSTGRGWTSCKRIRDPDSSDPDLRKPGAAEAYTKSDITTNGAHVAYLIHHDDENVENPIARIVLNPYISASGQHTILRPPRDREKKDKVLQYGGGNDSFGNTVRNWSEQNFPQREDEPFYKIHHAAYDDENINDSKVKSHYFNPNINGKTLHKMVKQVDPTTVSELLTHPETDEKVVSAAYSRPDIESKIAALKHPLVNRKHIDEAMSSGDDRLHEAVMNNPNATKEDISFGLRHNLNTVKRVALRHKRASEEDLHHALNDKSTDEFTREAIKKRLKQKEQAQRLLAMRNR